MFRPRAHGLILASILVLTISGGGLLHAAIPHSHGDNHGNSESALWTALHGALRHDDKKALFIVTEALILLVLLMLGSDLARAWMRVRLRIREYKRARGDDPLRGMALRRGILKYRAFG